MKLSLVQVGAIWGAGGLLGIFSGLLGGMLGDKVGTKRVMVVGTLLGGLLSIARGFAGDFISMMTLMIILGAVIPFVLINGIKTVGEWFPPQQLGLANGIVCLFLVQERGQGVGEMEQ